MRRELRQGKVGGSDVSQYCKSIDLIKFQSFTCSIGQEGKRETDGYKEQCETISKTINGGKEA